MSSDYDPDENDVRGEQSMSKTTRRGALAALGLGGLTMLGSSSASANIAGGPESDEIAHLARPVYEGPEDDLPGAGVEGRRYTVTDQGGVYPQYTELRDTGSEWSPINLGVGSLNTENADLGDANAESVETGIASVTDQFNTHPGLGGAILELDTNFAVPHDELTTIEWDGVGQGSSDFWDEENPGEIIIPDWVTEAQIVFTARWESSSDGSRYADLDIPDVNEEWRASAVAPPGPYDRGHLNMTSPKYDFGTTSTTFGVRVLQDSGGGLNLTSLRTCVAVIVHGVDLGN